MKDPGLAKAAGNAAAVGTVVTCPCSPPEAAGGTFVNDYKAKWNVDAGTYSRRGVRRGEHVPAGHRRG